MNAQNYLGRKYAIFSCVVKYAIPFTQIIEHAELLHTGGMANDIASSPAQTVDVNYFSADDSCPSLIKRVVVHVPDAQCVTLDMSRDIVVIYDKMRTAIGDGAKLIRPSTFSPMGVDLFRKAWCYLVQSRARSSDDADMTEYYNTHRRQAQAYEHGGGMLRPGPRVDW